MAPLPVADRTRRERRELARVEISLLGGFRVVADGREARFEHRRAADLVKLLALAVPHRLPRDRVVEALWPGLGADSGAANLHKAASNARRALGHRQAVVLRTGLVELAPGAEIVTDVARFEAGDDSAYAGPLLPDDAYEPWTLAERERLQDRHAARLRRRGRWTDVVALDPADETAWRELVRACLEDGDRLGAARRLRRLRDELSRVGLPPSPETLDLGIRLAEGPAVRAPVPGTTPPAGAAAAALRAATAGRGTTLVLSTGTPAQRARWIDALLAGAARRDWHTLRGAGHGAGAGVPLRPLVQALDPLLLDRPDLVAALPRGSRAALAGLSPAASGHVEDAGAAGPEAVAVAVGHLARAAARERGLVLALEELDGADAGSVRVVDYLATVARTEPLVVVAGGTSPALARLAATLRARGTGAEIGLSS